MKLSDKIKTDLLLKIFLPGVIFLHLSATAQKAGYMGKKLILKTNVINGRFLGFNGADLEFVTGRKTALNLAFETINYSRNENGVKRYTGKVKPRNGDGEYREKSILKNGTTSGWNTSLGIKIYFNSIIPAPYGFYTSFSVGFGKAVFENYDVSYTYKESMNSYDQNKILEKPEVKGLSGEAYYYTAELPSIGYQRIYKRFIVLDCKLSAYTQYAKLPDNLVNAIEHNYYLRSNTVSYGMGNFSMGLNLFVKLGVLLF